MSNTGPQGAPARRELALFRTDLVGGDRIHKMDQDKMLKLMPRESESCSNDGNNCNCTDWHSSTSLPLLSGTLLWPSADNDPKPNLTHPFSSRPSPLCCHTPPETHGECKQWILKKEREGEASNPGPERDRSTTLFINNITSYAPNKQHLAALSCDFAFWQETKVASKVAKGYIADLWHKGWNATFEPIQENTVGLSAGVAGIAKRPNKASVLKPINPALTKFIKMGRLQFSCIPIEGNDSMVVYNCYCWPGSQQKSDGCDKGDKLFGECNVDAKERGDVAITYVGDFNAHITKYHNLQNLIKHNGWLDLGAHASRWGGFSHEPTCRSNERATFSTIDYALANPKAQSMGTGFRTTFHNAIATHARLEVDLKANHKPSSINVQSKPNSLTATIHDYIASMTADLTDDKEVNKFEATTYERLRLHMDNELGNVSAQLDHMANMWNTDAFWKTFAIAVESAYIKTCELTEDKARQIRGHGKAAIKKQRVAIQGTITLDDDVFIGKIDLEADRLRMQSRRRTMIAQYIKTISNTTNTECTIYNAAELLHNTAAQFIGSSDLTHNKEVGLAELCLNDSIDQPKNYAVFQNAAKHFDTAFRKQVQHLQNAKMEK